MIYSHIDRNWVRFGFIQDLQLYSWVFSGITQAELGAVWQPAGKRSRMAHKPGDELQAADHSKRKLYCTSKKKRTSSCHCFLNKTAMPKLLESQDVWEKWDITIISFSATVFVVCEVLSYCICKTYQRWHYLQVEHFPINYLFICPCATLSSAHGRNALAQCKT